MGRPAARFQVSDGRVGVCGFRLGNSSLLACRIGVTAIVGWRPPIMVRGRQHEPHLLRQFTLSLSKQNPTAHGA